MLEAIAIELIRIFFDKSCKTGSWVLSLVHVINDHIIHYTDLSIVRVGFSQEQNKEFKPLRDEVTEVLNTKALKVKAVINIASFCVSHKNLPKILTSKKVFVNSRENVS